MAGAIDPLKPNQPLTKTQLQGEDRWIYRAFPLSLNPVL